MDTNTNMLQMYQNSGYNNTRNRKRTLVLDVDDITGENLGKTGEFKVNLFEPLIIDKHSEVYLDNFTSYNSNLASNLDLTAFCLKINEFNMNSNVASSRSGGTIFNSLVIPNEHRNPDNFQTSVVHKGKKFNYVCDINPGTISSLSGKITDLGGFPAFHDSTGTGAVTYTIIGIDPANFEKLTQPMPGGPPNFTVTANPNSSILGGSTITSFNIPSGTVNINNEDEDAVIQPNDITGSFIVNTSLTGSTITFTTSEKINKIISTGSDEIDIKLSTDISGVGDIYFIVSETPNDLNNAIRIKNRSGYNPGMAIIEGHGRFIAEFSIISRE